MLAKGAVKPGFACICAGTFTVRGCPTVTAGLDGELARLQDQGTGGMAPLATPHKRQTSGTAFMRAVTGSDASRLPTLPWEKLSRGGGGS